MSKEKVIIANLACTSDLCSMVEFDAQLLRDLIDDLESGWVETRAQDPVPGRYCQKANMPRQRMQNPARYIIPARPTVKDRPFSIMPMIVLLDCSYRKIRKYDFTSERVMKRVITHDSLTDEVSSTYQVIRTRNAEAPPATQSQTGCSSGKNTSLKRSIHLSPLMAIAGARETITIPKTSERN